MTMKPSILPSKQHGLNSRQYRFCLNIMQGMSQTEAYLQAGYDTTREMATVCASELLTKPHVSSFLASYQEKQLAMVESQLLSKSEKRTILASIARATLIDLIDDDGNLKIDRKSSAVKALKEYYRKVRLDRDGNPIVISSAKLLDPLAAIMEDNKMTGDYAPSKSLHAHRVQFDINLVDRGKRIEE